MLLKDLENNKAEVNTATESDIGNDRLLSIRVEINGIDTDIVELFARRMELSKGIAEEKMALGLPVMNLERENAVLEKVAAEASPELAEYVKQLYKTIFELSRSYQHKLLDNPHTLKTGGQ